MNYSLSHPHIRSEPRPRRRPPVDSHPVPPPNYHRLLFRSLSSSPSSSFDRSSARRRATRPAAAADLAGGGGDAEVKGEYSTRDLERKVVYNTSLDYSAAGVKANWRDTVTFFMRSQPPLQEELPLDCRVYTLQTCSLWDSTCWMDGFMWQDIGKVVV